MDQLQNFTTSDYLQKSNIFNNNWKQKRKKYWNFFLLHSFEFGKNVISEIFIEYKKGRDLTDTFGG